MVIQGTNGYIDNGNGVIEFSLVFYVAPVIFIDDRGSPLIQTSSRPAQEINQFFKDIFFHLLNNIIIKILLKAFLQYSPRAKTRAAQ